MFQYPTENTTAPVCPYCQASHPEPEDLDESEAHCIECDDCGKLYAAVCDYQGWKTRCGGSHKWHALNGVRVCSRCGADG